MDIGSNKGLKKLVEITCNIRKWNMMGQSLLPELQIVILYDKNYIDLIKDIIHDFEAQQMVVSAPKVIQKQQLKQYSLPNYSQNNQQQIKGIQSNIYYLYKMRNSIKGSLHIIQGLADSTIYDEDFRKRKQLIDKFVKNRSSIFILFDKNEFQLLQRNQVCLSQFGLTQNSNKFILYTINSSKWQLYNRILLRYQQIFRYDLVTNYQLMKKSKKQLQRQLSRYIHWKKFIDQQIQPTTYALYMFKTYTDTMKSSFSGTYSTNTHFQYLGMGKSIHWKISQHMAEFWEIQGDILFKHVDKMPLKYIQQQYEMSDYYSIGGFLPDTCFKQIFSPPLKALQNSLEKALASILAQVTHYIQTAVCYIFKNTSIVDEFMEKESNRIEQKICINFQKQFRNSLSAQIEYVYATPEQFWNYRQLNSNLYSPDQQVFLEIKYIGKAYVRRVFQRMKQNVPRMIYQNLLRAIVKYLNEQSIDTFLEILRQSVFEININPQQLETYKEQYNKLKSIQKLINFFSLKVSSPILIKKFHEKKKKDWDRMFGKQEQRSSDQDKNLGKNLKSQQIEQKRGFIRWMKQLFSKQNSKQRNNRIKRSHSLNKNDQLIQQNASQAQHQIKQNDQIKVLDEKHWLLILNLGKQIPARKLDDSAAQGFPSRLRPAIWMYLAQKSGILHQHIKLNTLLQNNSIKPNVRRQIQKDVLRTPPASIFKYSLKESLTRVLQGYSLFDKELEYTQGMNFIAANILLTLTNHLQKQTIYSDGVINFKQIEEKAFILLKYLMEKKGVKKIMSVDAQLISQIALRLQSRIQQLSPESLNCINRTLFNCQMIFSSPIISCLAGVPINFKAQKRIMDILMIHGIYIIHKIIAQFVAASQKLIIELHPDKLYDYFRVKMYEQVYSTSGQKGMTAMFLNL